MITSRVWAVSLVLSLLVACGGSGSGNDGGGGSSGGGTTGAGGSGGSSGGGTTGAGGGGGRGGGAAGSGGSGGSGGNCQMCIACVQSMCASQLATCQANASCNAIWQCAIQCTMHLDDCIVANTAGVATWGPTVAACANVNCVSNGCPY